MHFLIEFYLPRLCESKSDGRRNLQIIADLLPELSPELYNSFEPVNKKFNDIETALEDWGNSFLWRRKKPLASGMVTFGNAHPRRPFHTSLSLHGRLEANGTDSLTRFVQDFSKTFRPDIGLIHVFPKLGHGNRQPVLNLSTFVMKESLPNLYWTTVFGRPYVKLFGKEKLLSVSAFAVKELDDDSIYIQLTQGIADNRNSPERVEAVRQAAKKHLDSNVFFDPERGLNHVYSTPEFYIQQ